MSKSIAEVIEVAGERFKQIADTGMNYEAEKGFAVQLLKNNAYLMKTAIGSPTSLQQAITNVAAIGLSLNPAEKLAYLIPRKMKIGQDKWEARIFLEPSYMGLIRLATNSGSIKWIQANVVYSSDTFADNGMGEKITHTFNPFAKADERGEIIGCYATAKTLDGDYLTATMTLDRIHAVRDRSESYKKYKSGVWVDDFVEMAKKAVIRLLFKTLPRTDENYRMALAVSMSNDNEGFQPIVTEPNVNEYTAEQKEYFDGLIEGNKAFDMYVFTKSIDIGVFTSLAHSFKKGTKGKYRKIIDSLNSDGFEIANQYANYITDFINSNDKEGLEETLSELSSDEIAVIEPLLDPETRAAFGAINND